MTLGQLIEFLEQRNGDTKVPMGFSDPHSYRGHYHNLAFRPTENVTVGDMLRDARSAIGETYEGYKGGEYEMSEHTDVWLADYGKIGETIGEILLKYMVGEYYRSAQRE